jgi:large subunit ribosomal protein L19
MDKNPHSILPKVNKPGITGLNRDIRCGITILLNLRFFTFIVRLFVKNIFCKIEPTPENVKMFLFQSSNSKVVEFNRARLYEKNFREITIFSKSYKNTSCKISAIDHLLELSNLGGDMSDQIMTKVAQLYLRKDIPVFKSGDTVKVHFKISEGGKTRIQVFQGIVIGRKGDRTDEMVTVRKIAAGNVGVERVFPIHAPVVDKIEVIRKGKVRRAKLTYLRKKVGKDAKVKELREVKVEEPKVQ